MSALFEGMGRGLRAAAGAWGVAMVGLALAACGGEPPPPAQEPQAEPERPAVKPQLKMKSELGLVDPAAVTAAFHKLDDRFDACQKRGLDRVEVLAGQVKFFLRIGEDGSARWAYLEDSSVGDRATEKCLLGAVMAARWPRPDGGDAEARYTMELPAQGRPATEWEAGRVSAALGKVRGALDECKAGAGAGSMRATLYVGPGGKVLAAGVAAPSKDGAGPADCMAEVLEKLKGLPSPGSWPAKVTVSL